MALSLKSLISGARDALPRLRFGPFGRDGLPAGLFVKSPEALELERMNPLRGVDEWRLGQIFDDARDGVFADLAWLYNEIEGVEPALLACCETRESAAGELGWVVRTADAERTRDFDETLADEQRAALLAEFGAVADDLPELAGHMVSAFFRGAAHALPLWDESGSLAGFRPLDLWNFALDRQSGLWYWNADASRDEGTFQAIPRGALVSLSASRHVDHAALPIFIRAALGAKRYGVWLDRFGIPPTAVIMPPNAERGEQAAYMDLARKFARGGSGILPNGSQVTYGTEARAVCPFPDFIRFQQQQIYAVGIGRVQSGETDGSNLGGNAAGVVDAALRRIVRRDARRIARALNDCVTRRVLARLFPGRPVLAQFAWDTEAKRTGREALEDAGLARAAGLSIDRAQLEEMTGYTLAEAPQPPAGGLPGAPGFGLNAQEARNAIAKPLQNARSASDGKSPDPTPPPALKRVLEAFRTDLGPAAEELQRVLALPEAEMRAACRDLAGRLPDLLPPDPAMAAILAEELAGAFAEAAGETSHEDTKARSGEALANEECRAKDPATCPVRGTPKSRRGWDQEQVASGKRKVGSLIEDLGKRGPDGKSKAWKNHDEELGALNAQVAADIKKANPNMKADAGTMQTVDVDQLNHAMLEHGEGREKWPTSVGITHDDLKRIPEVLSDYDEIVPGLGKADGKKQEAVIFKKRYPDGTVCCVEIDSFVRADNKRVLKFQTMWKDKN